MPSLFTSLIVFTFLSIIFPMAAQSAQDCEGLAKIANSDMQIASERGRDSADKSSADVKSEIESIRIKLLSEYKFCSSNPAYINELTYLDLSAGKKEEALKHVSHGLNLNPDEIGLMITKSRVLDQVGKSEAGLLLLAKAFEKDQNNHFVNYEYCGKLIEVKDHAKAIIVCTLAIDTGNPNTLPWSYLNRGIANKMLGNVEAAKKDRAESKKNGMSDWLVKMYLPLDD